MNYTPFIRPEILAAKMDAVQRLAAPQVAAQLKTHPRLFEALWAIQGLFMLPGGAERFVQSFLEQQSGRLGVPAMRPAPKGRALYSKKQRDAIILQIPTGDWIDFMEKHGLTRSLSTYEMVTIDLDDPLVCAESDEKRLQFVSTLNFDTFHALCRAEAASYLVPLLSRVCHEVESPLEDPWYFTGLLDALTEFIDSHAAQTFPRLAKTEVSLKIFDALEYARAENALVKIEGDSRFGKTESVKTWCAAWPGKARLVSVPCSNTDADLFKAFADALGVEYTFRTSPREIKATIEYIIRHSGLMFVADEAHFLLPARFSLNTPPMRLNWMRTQIVDKKCPVVLVSTPQDYRKCVDKFVKATGHNIQQFLGRTMLNVSLPTELEADDLLAVAKIHFPDLGDDFLQFIVGTAMQAESYLMAVEALAKRVRYIARRDGHKAVTLADLKLAISEIMPAPPAPPKPAFSEKVLTPAPLAIRREARPRPSPLKAPARSITPEHQSV